jgi:hypothetical protein
MNDWQTWLTMGICLAAAIYVARRAWLALAGKKAPGCGSGCGSCQANVPAARQLVSIELPPPPK